MKLPPIGQLGPFIALIIACAIFGATTDRFFSGENFSLILQQVMVVGVIAIGQTLIILTAGIDLSCGMVMALGSIVMTKFAADMGLPAPLAVLCGVGATALFGLLNGLLEHLMIPETSWPVVYAVLDKLERQPREVSAEKLVEAGLDAATQDVVLGFGTVDFATLQARYGDAPAVKPHLDRFAEYLRHLDALGVGAWVRVDLTIVRGLAYYTGIVFELFDNIGEFRAICGGGRYDTLLKSLGGTDLPALGFGMGDVVLGELLRARGLMPSTVAPLHYWVEQAPETPFAPAAALQTATALRQGGAIVEHALRPMKLDKQLEAGRKAGAAAFVIVDPAATDAPWRVRRAGHDDQLFSTLEALCAWATSTTGSTP